MTTSLIQCHAHEAYVGELLLQFGVCKLPYNRSHGRGELLLKFGVCKLPYNRSHGLNIVDIHHEMLKARDCDFALSEKSRIELPPFLDLATPFVSAFQFAQQFTHEDGLKDVSDSSTLGLLLCISFLHSSQKNSPSSETVYQRRRRSLASTIPNASCPS